MLVGYARVSTDDQHLDLQRDALTQAGCARFFEEKLSGANGSRPALRAVMRQLRRGDVLVVWKLDRLGRSLQDLIKILNTLERRGIGFLSITNGIDTTTPAGKLVFHISGSFAEYERAMISERTRAGMEAARRRGRPIGRPRRLSRQQVEEARRLAAVDHRSLREIAAQMRVARTTVWRALAGSQGSPPSP